MRVTKRDGKLELVDLDKIHRVLEWAVEGLDNVSVSEIEMKSNIQLFDGMSTNDIHETLIKTSADLISESTPNYQYVAARLAVFHIRKEAFGRFTSPSLFNHITKLTNSGHYDKHILEDYDESEIDWLDEQIEHKRDLNFAYAGIQQLLGKYLVQNRVTKKIYESPQMLYMLVAMCLFSKYPKTTRLDYVSDFYDAVSEFKISLPTPIMSGVRTPTRQFSSCVVIESGDSLDSINATTSSIVKYVSRRAGIGIGAGSIRALGSEIRGGEAQHTGVIPFLKLFQAAVKSCSQGGVRGGAATVFYPMWHLEVESLLVLKNNRGVEDNRVRHMDYGVQINKLLYNRLIKNENITLFSPSDVPNLYDSFFADQDLFEELYVKYEQDESIRKRSISATELFSLMMQERASTGRIYIQNVDHCNTHSPFNPKIAPIKMSNLCLEIAIPTTPLDDLNDAEGEIGLCTLAAVNLGKIKTVEDIEHCGDLLVRALDELLDYQDYPMAAAEHSSKNRRMLGVGVINFAYYLAKNGLKYSDGSAKELTHQTFEALQYYLLKSSNALAKEKGACGYYKDTKYSDGIFTIDTYKDTVDTICDTKLECDWDTLRADVAKYGLRNSTLTAQMPSETSSQISNSTNGIESPRGLISVKASKDGILKQVVPEIDNPDVKYELLWEMPNNKGSLELIAIMQKFIDQSISANTNYDPTRFQSGKVPMKQLLQDILTAYKLGVKTLYYHNTRDGANDGHEDDCESGACKI